MVEGGPFHKRWWKEVLLIKDGGRRSPSFQAPKELSLWWKEVLFIKDECLRERGLVYE